MHIDCDEFQYMCGRKRKCNVPCLRTDEAVREQAAKDVSRICLGCYVKWGIAVAHKAQVERAARAICGQIVE